MKNTFGQHLAVTLFGESHGAAIGAVLDGLCPGIPVDEENIRRMLQLRQPGGAISTARKEKDLFQIVSGAVNGVATGTPLTILIPNQDTKSGDYSAMQALMRPGHADYPAQCKYHGHQDVRGGGHFSGRITAALVAAGAVCHSALQAKGISIGTHISRCAGIPDRAFGNLNADIQALSTNLFPVLDSAAAEKMQQAILAAKAEGDSVGGVLETAVVGLPAGVGEPWFDTFESQLAHILFSVPAVKGVEFGDGFALADMKGSTANDPLRYQDGTVVAATNHGGGIGGGITSGMPVIFRCAVKPTPSIAKPQQTVDILRKENADLEIHGRHDPAIVHRARIVIDAVTAIAVYDMLAGRFGTDFFAKED
jgi:chorismate synthase